MPTISNIYKILLAFSLSLFACAAPARKDSGIEDKRLLGEKAFDPLGFAGDDSVITGKFADRLDYLEKKNETSIDLDSLTRNSPGPAKIDTVLYRVQIYTTKSFDDAQEYLNTVKRLFPEGVFVEYQIPYYKVRVGEYHSAAEGEAFLDKVKQLGFENAWLVRIIR